MKYTIYKTTNLLNGKYYIGKHQTSNPDDAYYGSGKAIERAIKKHGKENFVKTVLFIFDDERQMNDKERELITEAVVADPMSYNMGVGGEGGPHFKGRTHTEASKVKFSRRGKPISAETRLKIADAIRQRGPRSDETKQKISEAAKRRKMSPEASTQFSEKISAKMKLYWANKKRDTQIVALVAY